MPEFGMTAWTRRFVERDLARCATHRFEIVDEAGDRDPRFFSEREAAERWLERQHASLARRYSVAGSQTVRDGSFVAGFVDSASPVQGGPLGIMFAPVDAPVDEVRVLPWSVHVSDGALRGLVRNWSRHLWAYDVTITADGRSFVWPLSVQPGETAPFEIGGWQGPSERGSVDVRVTGDMSPYVDPSRAFAYDSAYASYGNYPQDRIEVSGDGWDRYSDVWTQQETGAASVGLFMWQPRRIVPDSHPSLIDDIAKMHVGDLRAYGAVLDGTGRVLQVSPALVGHLAVAYADSGAVSGAQWIHEPPSDSGWTAPRAVALPVFEELPRPPPEGAVMGVYFHSYDPSTGEYLRWDNRSGGFIIWIGAAHPARDTPQG